MQDRIKQFLQTTQGKVASAIIVAILAGVGITVAVTQNENGTTVTITVNEQKDRAPSVGAQPTEITVPKAVVENPEKVAPDLSKGFRDETPPGAPPAELDAAQQQQEQIQATNPLPLTFPLASTSFKGCKPLFVRNQSSRNGVTPTTFWVHYTAGLGTIYSLAALFDRASFQASSHFVMERSGRCGYLVPTYRKAWTQAAANPIGVSVEVINTGAQKPFMTAAGYRALGRLIARVHHQFPSIKLQRGKISGCRSTRSGIVTHWMGGQCSGGHVDIRPYSLKPIIKAARRANCNLYHKGKASKRRCLRKVH